VVEKSSTDATVLARMDYVYHDETSSFATSTGRIGDLMRIKVTEKDSSGDDIVRHTLFRYYPTQGSIGAPHKLRWIVGPEAYENLLADPNVTDPFLASDSSIALYADGYFEYGQVGNPEGNFVSKATLRGAGCSCSSGQGIFTFAYAFNGSWTTSSGPSVWKVSVRQTNPDGTVKIVDVNGHGSVINEVLQSDATYDGNDQRWITSYAFDSVGRPTELYHPSACASYNESTHAVTLNTDSGLIDLFVYDSSGNLTGRKAKEGTSGAAYWQERREITSQTAGSHTIYVPDEIWTYPTARTRRTRARRTSTRRGTSSGSATRRARSPSGATTRCSDS
jgi:hypothetical protein